MTESQHSIGTCINPILILKIFDNMSLYNIFLILQKGPYKTKIRVSIDSLDLPTSDMGNCYHYLEIRDYLTGAPGKL